MEYNLGGLSEPITVPRSFQKGRDAIGKAEHRGADSMPTWPAVSTQTPLVGRR